MFKSPTILWHLRWVFSPCLQVYLQWVNGAGCTSFRIGILYGAKNDITLRSPSSFRTDPHDWLWDVTKNDRNNLFFLGNKETNRDVSRNDSTNWFSGAVIYATGCLILTPRPFPGGFVWRPVVRQTRQGGTLGVRKDGKIYGTSPGLNAHVTFQYIIPVVPHKAVAEVSE